MTDSSNVFTDVNQPAEPSSVVSSNVHPSTRWMRFVRWTRRIDLAPKLELILAIAAIIAGSVAYYVLSMPSDPLEEGRQTSVTLVIFLLLVPILGLTALIARRLFHLLADRRRQSAGSRLHGRMVLIFSAVAIVPTLLIGIFASLLFEFGLQVWFSDRVRTVLDNASTVAEGYVREHRKIIEADLRAMANDLNRNAFTFQQNRDALQQEVFRQAAIRSLNEAIMFDAEMNVIARASFNLSQRSGGLSRSDLDRAIGGDLVLIDEVSDETDRVGALLKLESFYETFLYVSRRVDPTVMASYQGSKGALSDYESLDQERERAQIRFNLMLISVVVALLLAAVMLGLWFATRLISPISHLVSAAEQVRQGDLGARVPLKGAMDEIGTLSRAFNRMTSQLQTQRQRLIATNEELEQRRTFIETVLEGVSAGVIGLTPSAKIDAVNRSAVELLEIGGPENALGLPLASVVPEIGQVLSAVNIDELDSFDTQVELAIGDAQRTLNVRISTEKEGERITGYVVTFDDMTEQLSYQRRAAWADVARRIAHEIKNPLTPIQLSAERLQRKYQHEIESDPSVFERCTDTIIRQVGDLRQMVDEFSSFARMPAPNFEAADIKDILRQAVFLQEVGSNNVTFNVDAPDGTLVLPCDRRLIAQALTNILKNALESIQTLAESQSEDYRGVIDVALEETAEGVRISIKDNGKGLPVAERMKLMEPYVTTRAKGTGLGLAIVKKIMEDHGAHIALKDNEEGGAQVLLIFDRAVLDARLKRVSSQSALDDAQNSAAE